MVHRDRKGSRGPWDHQELQAAHPDRRGQWDRTAQPDRKAHKVNPALRDQQDRKVIPEVHPDPKAHQATTVQKGLKDRKARWAKSVPPTSTTPSISPSAAPAITAMPWGR